MKTVSLDEVMLFQSCPARWLYQYRYGVASNIPADELYVKMMRESLEKAFQKWYDVALLEQEHMIEDWAERWLDAAQHNGLSEIVAETKGIEGRELIKAVCKKLIGKYLPIDGPFDWCYDVPELKTSITGRALGLVRKKRKLNADHAYFVLEVLPASCRFWPSQIAFRLPEVAVRACRQIIEGGGTASSLALHPWQSRFIELGIDLRDRASLNLLDDLLCQMAALSIVPQPSQDKCSQCPYVKTCDIKYTRDYLRKRPQMAREEMEKICRIPQPNSYSTYIAMLERIMGYSLRMGPVISQ